MTKITSATTTPWATENTLMLSTAQLAAYFNKSTSTISSWRYNNTGPPYIKMGNGEIRYHLHDIKVWEQENQDKIS